MLSTRNDNFENLFCGHELGHHFCRHKGNAEYLERSNLAFTTIGNKYEANEFMVDMLLDGVHKADFNTK